MLGLGFGRGNGKGNRGFGRGVGRGMGRGLGVGRGLGLGRILGFCRFGNYNYNNFPLTNEEKELVKARLREELAFLEERKKLIEESLRNLEQ